MPEGHPPGAMAALPNSIPGVQSFLIGGVRFDIPEEYAPTSYINRGAFGVVCSGVHRPTNTNVAIKKVSSIFSRLENTKRLLREVKLLRHFDHENVLAIIDIFKPPSREEFEDLYIVTELMDTDLQSIIESGQQLSDQHIQYFIYQMLCAVKYIHSANVLHRDIKPGNILCNEDCTIKLADFGLARVQQQCDDLTEYVTTRWYRAPEIILSWKGYSKQIDIWSIGCILAELYLGHPLFQGNHYINQLERITDILGSATSDDIQMLASENARQFLINMGHKPKVPWSQIIPHAPPVVCDLLDHMLAFNPDKRYTVEQSLNHPYFADLRDPDEVEDSPKIFSFDFEKWCLSKEIYQDLFYHEICHFHPEVRHQMAARGITPHDHLPHAHLVDPRGIVEPLSQDFMPSQSSGQHTPDFDRMFGDALDDDMGVDG